MATAEAVNTQPKAVNKPPKADNRSPKAGSKAPKRKFNRRSTVSAIMEVLAFGASTSGDGGAETVTKLVKLNPSKNVVRMTLFKLGKAGQKDMTAILLRASDKLGFAFRGTTYVVGPTGRLIIPVDGTFKVGSHVNVTREAGLITVRSA